MDLAPNLNGMRLPGVGRLGLDESLMTENGAQESTDPIREQGAAYDAWGGSAPMPSSCATASSGNASEAAARFSWR